MGGHCSRPSISKEHAVTQSHVSPVLFLIHAEVAIGRKMTSEVPSRSGGDGRMCISQFDYKANLDNPAGFAELDLHKGMAATRQSLLWYLLAFHCCCFWAVNLITILNPWSGDEVIDRDA